jgi:hypothetical protein
LSPALHSVGRSGTRSRERTARLWLGFHESDRDQGKRLDGQNACSDSHAKSPVTAAVRLNTRRRERFSFPAPSALVLALAAGGWLLLSALILTHRVFVTNDSLNNYAHVWYIAEQLKSFQELPFKMPVLGHGAAYAYPYALIPWSLAALGQLVLGDWAVTLSLVMSVTAVIVTTYWALPELRTGSLAPFVLMNPFLVESLILGQLPFLWATATLFSAIAFWRHRRPFAATVACGLAQATHPAVIMPISLLLFLGSVRSEPRRKTLYVAYAASVAIATPAAVIVLVSPTVSETGFGGAVLNLVSTLCIRFMVFAVPLALAAWRQKLPARAVAYGPTFLALLLIPMVPLRQDGFAWQALVREPDHAVEAFTTSNFFQPKATYRVLRARDGKVAMYDVLKAGGSLDSEFFPESIHRSSFPDATAYARFLRERRVDFVVVFDSYTQTFHTNEIAMLTETLGTGSSELVFRGPGFNVFKMDGERGPVER